MFLMWEDKLIYGKFVEDIANDFKNNMKDYPDTLVQAYNQLVKFAGAQYHLGRHFIKNNKAMHFSNIEENKKRDISNIICLNC